MEEERRLIAQILERQQHGSTASSRGRDRELSRSMTPALSRSISRSEPLRVDMEDTEDQFLITAKDPSLRLNTNYLTSDRDEETEKEADKGLTPAQLEEKDKKLVKSSTGKGTVSEEEQISDTDSEFEYDDDGSVLPNYSTYNAEAVKRGEEAGPAPSRGGSIVAGATPARIDDADLYNASSPVIHKEANPELTEIKNRRLVKEAKQAERLDEVLAAERAASNARAIGQSVSPEFMEQVSLKAEQAGTGVHMDPESFYKTNPARKEKLQGYAKYKKKLVSPEKVDDGFVVPYTNDEEEKMDTELAQVLNENTKVSAIENVPETQRTVRTITRGNFVEKYIESGKEHPKSFVLCMDFSQESKNALEWCVGTVLVDGSVFYILNVIEDEEYSSMQLNGIQPKNSGKPASSHKSTQNADKARSRLREQNVEEITKEVLSLLKLTKLQVHVVVQSSHHPIPRHFVTSVVKHLSPTLVVVGSKGTSAMKGVLLGSLSNYLVRNSTAPVMVVKHRLKKLTKKKQYNNNVTPLHSLAEARVD